MLLREKRVWEMVVRDGRAFDDVMPAMIHIRPGPSTARKDEQPSPHGEVGFSAMDTLFSAEEEKGQPTEEKRRQKKTSVEVWR